MKVADLFLRKLSGLDPDLLELLDEIRRASVDGFFVRGRGFTLDEIFEQADHLTLPRFKILVEVHAASSSG
jgi:hypothetical protein